MEGEPGTIDGGRDPPALFYGWADDSAVPRMPAPGRSSLSLREGWPVRAQRLLMEVVDESLVRVAPPQSAHETTAELRS